MHFQIQVKIKRTFCRHILFKQTYIAQELGSKYKPVLEQCATPLVHCWHHRGQIVVVRAIKRIVAVAEQPRMVLAAQQRLGAPVSGHCTTRTSSSPASWSTDDPLNFTLCWNTPWTHLYCAKPLQRRNLQLCRLSSTSIRQMQPTVITDKSSQVKSLCF